MESIKPFLRSVYFAATRGYRSRTVRRLALAGRAPMVVPVFHRIADDNANDWTTSTEDFRESVHWLKEHFDLVSLEEMQRRIESSFNDRPSATITFDDGYAVNCDYALPLLVDEGIPCTYFVSADPVLNGTPFEHDRAMGNSFAPNTVEELRQFAATGIDVGAHTRTHADLAQVRDIHRLVDEMVTARNDLENALAAPIRYFAFPFGEHHNLSRTAFRLAREAGYAGVCSAYGGYNFAGDDPFHIQRRCVDGKSILLKNWALFDPLHLRRIERFEYQPDGASHGLAVSEAMA